MHDLNPFPEYCYPFSTSLGFGFGVGLKVSGLGGLRTLGFRVGSGSGWSSFGIRGGLVWI